MFELKKRSHCDLFWGGGGGGGLCVKGIVLATLHLSANVDVVILCNV